MEWMNNIFTLSADYCGRVLNVLNKGKVIRATFLLNLSRNIVALQVEKHCQLPAFRVLNLPRNKFQCCKLKTFVAKSRTRFHYLALKAK